ncbi:MAG: BrnA antitoxin family protein [Nitrospirota bacterium]|nr:BrnA antitoxin family protein [Nitrospirota bacterium]
MKKLSESSVRDWRIEKKKGVIKKRKIDYSDIPPLSDRQLASMRPVGRPPLGAERRQLIAIRLDPAVLRWLKSLAANREVPYQSLINDLLAGEMKRQASLSPSRRD